MSQFSQPFNIEQNAPRAGAPRNTGAGGLLGQSNQGGVRTSQVIAAGPSTNAQDQNALLETLAQSIGFTGQIIRQVNGLAADQLNQESQMMRMQIAEIAQVKENSKLADQQVFNTGVELASKALPDLQKRAATGELLPQQGEDYSTFVTRVRGSIMPDGTDPLMVKAADQVIARGLDQIVVGKAVQANAQAKADQKQATVDSILLGSSDLTDGSLMVNLSLYQATTGASEQQAMGDVLVPAMRAAAAAGNEAKVAQIAATLGTSFVAEQDSARKELEIGKARDSAQFTAAYNNSVSEASINYMLGKGTSAEYFNAIMAGKGRVPAPVIERELAQFTTMQDRLLKEQDRLIQNLRVTEATQIAQSQVRSAVNNGEAYTIESQIKMVDGRGEAVLDEKGQPRTIETSQLKDDAINYFVGKILNDQTASPEQRMANYGAWLSRTGVKHRQLSEKLSLGMTVDPKLFDLENKLDKDQQAQVARNFFVGYEAWKAMPAAVVENHTDKPTREIYQQVHDRLSTMPSFPGETEAERTIGALREVRRARDMGAMVAPDANALKSAVSGLMDVNKALFWWQPDDPKNVGQVRDAVAREYRNLMPGIADPAAAMERAAARVSETHRQIGPALVMTADPRIGQSSDTTSDRADFLKVVAKQRAEKFIAANPNLKLTTDDFTIMPDDKGAGWRIYRIDDESGINLFSLNGPDALVSYSEMQKMLRGNSVAAYLATDGFKFPAPVKGNVKFNDIPSPPAAMRGRRLDY